MKKGVIIALLSMATGTAAVAGWQINQQAADPSPCCDTSTCCPDDTDCDDSQVGCCE